MSESSWLGFRVKFTVTARSTANLKPLAFKLNGLQSRARGSGTLSESLPSTGGKPGKVPLADVTVSSSPASSESAASGGPGY